MFRVIYYMVYYSDKESEAVRMLADRVREHDDYEYKDFTPDQIINPKLKTHFLEFRAKVNEKLY